MGTGSARGERFTQGKTKVMGKGAAAGQYRRDCLPRDCAEELQLQGEVREYGDIWNCIFFFFRNLGTCAWL